MIFHFIHHHWYSERLPFLALKHHEVVQQRQKVNRSSPSSPSSSHLVALKGIHFTWRMRLCLAPSFAKQIEPFLWKCWEGSLVNQPVHHHHHNQNDTRISDHKSVNWFWIILQNNSRYVEIRTSMNSKSKIAGFFLAMWNYQRLLMKSLWNPTSEAPVHLPPPQ